jgi:hypothetical protein
VNQYQEANTMAKQVFNGTFVDLVWKHGEEAICPVCDSRNACLHTGSIGKATTYECRDCHTIFLVDMGIPAEDLGELPPLNRKAAKRTARVVARSLGKTCYVCNSFDMKSMPIEKRYTWQDAFVAAGKGDKWKALMECPTHICGNCGKEHKY